MKHQKNNNKPTKKLQTPVLHIVIPDLTTKSINMSYLKQSLEVKKIEIIFRNNVCTDLLPEGMQSIPEFLGWRSWAVVSSSWPSDGCFLKHERKTRKGYFKSKAKTDLFGYQSVRGFYSISYHKGSLQEICNTNSAFPLSQNTDYQR